MLVLGILIGLCVLGVILLKTMDDEILGVIIAIFSGMLLLIALILLPFSRMEYNAGIERFKSTQQTYETARLNNVKIENAAIQMDIAKMNRDLASAQYYNQTVFDMWIPEEIMELKPIE